MGVPQSDKLHMYIHMKEQLKRGSGRNLLRILSFFISFYAAKFHPEQEKST